MKLKKYLCAFCVISLMAILLTVPAFAAGGDVAGAVEQTWDDAATQIKTVVDNVVFPALSMILAVAFFVKLGMSYFDYRTRGQFEWTGPAILFVCLMHTVGTDPLHLTHLSKLLTATCTVTCCPGPSD